MKILIVFSVVTSFIAGSLPAQNQTEIPKLKINPDLLPRTIRILDSVVQYTKSSSGDSAYLRRWNYVRQEEGNICESVMHCWNPILKAWSAPRSKYVYGLDTQGRLYLQEHDTYKYSNGTWKGCNSEGCGKKEWAYDSFGNQILWTQSYWNSNAMKWEIFDHWEKEFQYDSYGHLVLESQKESNKNEYSYDINGNQIGHVGYYWTGGDPYDWRPQYKVERSFDSNGNMEKLETYVWSEGKWIGSYDYGSNILKWDKVELKYDSNGQKTSVLLFRWDHDQNSWVADLKEDNKYDILGRLISEMIIRFNDPYPQNFYPERK